MFKGPGKIVRDNKSSSYPVFELTGVNCVRQKIQLRQTQNSVIPSGLFGASVDLMQRLIWCLFFSEIS